MLTINVVPYKDMVILENSENFITFVFIIQFEFGFIWMSILEIIFNNFLLKQVFDQGTWKLKDMIVHRKYHLRIS